MADGESAASGVRYQVKYKNSPIGSVIDRGKRMAAIMLVERLRWRGRSPLGQDRRPAVETEFHKAADRMSTLVDDKQLLRHVVLHDHA
jgi:hypothetical protein